jgi:hypothetical protein
MISEFPKRDLERNSADKFVLLTGRDVDDAGRLMRLLSEPSEDATLATSTDRPQMISRALLIEGACKERMRRRRRATALPKKTCLGSQPGTSCCSFMPNNRPAA